LAGWGGVSRTAARGCGKGNQHGAAKEDMEKETGAGEGIRTLDPNLGKVASCSIMIDHDGSARSQHIEYQ